MLEIDSKISNMRITRSFSFLIILSLIPGYTAKDSITCRDENGKAVDWFIVYKMPKKPSRAFREGYGYYYMDVNNPKWTLGLGLINQRGNAVSHTLQQIYDNYKSKDVMYLMYNDETPAVEKVSDTGHTKGSMCFDKHTGFWLVHSVPKFPPFASTHYGYPKSGSYFGQSFLCVTYSYHQLNEIGGQLMYNYPKIYNYSVPEAFKDDAPNMEAVISGKHVQQEPWNHSLTLTSIGQEKFTVFAKFANFDADLYHDWLAPYFKSNVYVESWMNGRGAMPSNCTGHYKAYNIKEVKMLNMSFHETSDHAKWAITEHGNWTCIGDINRQASQEKRPGGTVCFQRADVWNQFMQLVGSVEPCPKESSTHQPAVSLAGISNET